MTPKQLRGQILSIWKQGKKDGKTVGEFIEILNQLSPEVKANLLPPPPPKPPKGGG